MRSHFGFILKIGEVPFLLPNGRELEREILFQSEEKTLRELLNVRARIQDRVLDASFFESLSQEEKEAMNWALGVLARRDLN